jgi:hypothetical protein
MELEAVGIAVNEVWIVLAAIPVMFMQAGPLGALRVVGCVAATLPE